MSKYNVCVIEVQFGKVTKTEIMRRLHHEIDDLFDISVSENERVVLLFLETAVSLVREANQICR